MEDRKYEPESGRRYVHACQLQEGDVTLDGHIVTRVELERPDVAIWFAGMVGEPVVRNAATRIYLLDN